jgi:hypothetical protein
MGLVPLNLPKEESDDFVRRCFTSFYDTTDVPTVYISGETWESEKEAVKNLMRKDGIDKFKVIIFNGVKNET